MHVVWPVLFPSEHEGVRLQGWEGVDVIEGMGDRSFEKAVTVKGFFSFAAQESRRTDEA